ESSWRIITYYKNQKAENSLKTKFLGFELNIHKDQASTVLELNRNKVRPEYHHELNRQFFTSSFKVITENFDSIFESIETKCMGSMFLNYYHEQYDFLKSFDVKKFDQWENLEINVSETIYKIKDLLNDIDILKVVYDRRTKSHFADL